MRENKVIYKVEKSFGYGRKRVEGGAKNQRRLYRQKTAKEVGQVRVRNTTNWGKQEEVGGETGRRRLAPGVSPCPDGRPCRRWVGVVQEVAAEVRVGVVVGEIASVRRGPASRPAVVPVRRRAVRPRHSGADEEDGNTHNVCTKTTPQLSVHTTTVTVSRLHTGPQSTPDGTRMRNWSLIDGGEDSGRVPTPAPKKGQKSQRRAGLPRSTGVFVGGQVRVEVEPRPCWCGLHKRTDLPTPRGGREVRPLGQEGPKDVDYLQWTPRTDTPPCRRRPQRNGRGVCPSLWTHRLPVSNSRPQRLNTFLFLKLSHCKNVRGIRLAEGWRV